MKYSWDLHFKFDRSYWWAQGRKELVLSQLKRYLSLPGKRVLDLGCGSGTLLEALQSLEAEAVGIDTSLKAVKFCKTLGLNVRKGSATNIPFKEGSFDIICMIDVLEHIKEQDLAISEAKRVVKKQGFIFIVGPAFPLLWSSRDRRLGHLRRYIKKDLEKLLRRNGFRPLKTSYFVFFFFPFWLARVLVERFYKKGIKADLLLVPRPINNILLSILRLENFWLRFSNFPLGVSVFSIWKKS